MDCEDFIDPNGNYGQYGEALMTVIGGDKTPDLYSGQAGDIAQVCPNYAKFSDSEKRNFWVMVRRLGRDGREQL